MKQITGNQQALNGTVTTPKSSPGLSPRETLLLELTATFKEELTQEQMRPWRRLLDNYDLEDLKFAFDKWTDHENFFPKPAEIRQLIATKHALEAESYKSGTYGGGRYGSAEVVALCDIYLEKYPPPQTKRLTLKQRYELVDELDRRIRKAQETPKGAIEEDPPF